MNDRAKRVVEFTAQAGDCIRVTSWSWRMAPPPDPVAERRAREAPLVALVAAVPSWADPVAWRAAVLAVDEECTIKGGPRATTIGDVWGAGEVAGVRRFAEGLTNRPTRITTPRDVAVDAYARALAPSAVVRPEWRERLPHGLACNAHEVP